MSTKIHVTDTFWIEYLKSTIEAGKMIVYDSSKIEIHLMDKDPLAYYRFTRETQLYIWTPKDIEKYLKKDPPQYATSKMEDFRH